ncbi:hypothetical protein Tco_0077436 [Tanacetum coccineum]
MADKYECRREERKAGGSKSNARLLVNARKKSTRHKKSVEAQRSRSPRHEYKSKERRRESTVSRDSEAEDGSASAHSDSRQKAQGILENYSDREDSDDGH